MLELPTKFLIKLEDEAHSKIVQEKLFAMGYGWRGHLNNATIIKHLSPGTTLRINNKNISYASHAYMEKTFIDHEYLTLKDIDNDEKSSILESNQNDKPIEKQNMTTNINLKNLRPGDAITVVDFTPEKKDGYTGIPYNAGKPTTVKAVTLPFVYVTMGYNGVIDTREYQIMRISKKALA